MSNPLLPLATQADLAKRGITVPSDKDVATLIESASAAIRDAAGCPIALTESTVEVLTEPFIDLPGIPIRSVSSVMADGQQIEDGWLLVPIDGQLVIDPRLARTLPLTITVTYEHGITVVPQDIVDLVCGMVSIAAPLDGDEYGSSGRITNVRLGDYSETRTAPKGADSPSPFTLPDSVRDRLRARFRGSVALIGSRR